MVAADGERWDARYANRGLELEPAPPDALVEAGLIDRVPTAGRALDVACGLGAQSIWMAQRGLDVTALDVSQEAIDRVSGAAQGHGVSDRITAVGVDLDSGLPVDLTGFDVVVCQRFRNPRLYSGLVSRLRPGGLLVVTVLSQTGASAPGPFHAPSGELRTAFDVERCRVLHHHEGNGQESIVIELNA
jgi:2-polyprenyl-3-methyl-5-hydroxy-6-metoxy-1,4-benzoquinol methylase